LDYWPSYAAISPRARAGYLEWLAAGRRNPGAPIGFVFLFFYGIERRVLVDAQTSEVARAEIDGLVDEIEALLAVYGDHPSFRGYASSFVEVGRLLHRSVPLDELEPRFDAAGWDVPLSTKLALGAYAHLRWLLMEPPGLAGLKRRLEVFDASARQALASFLVAVAAADGQFDPEEIKILRRMRSS